MRLPQLRLIALSLLHSFVVGGEEQPPPNVIVIFSDDLGYGELPVYREVYQGSQEFKTAIGSFTPHLDRLAKEGVVCTRAYGNNTCAPAKMPLLSGKWPTRKVTLGGQPMIGRATTMPYRILSLSMKRAARLLAAVDSRQRRVQLREWSGHTVGRSDDAMLPERPKCFAFVSEVLSS